MPFVYRITNKKTGAVYIGKARDPNKRWKEHLDVARNFEHPFYRAIYEDGSENFSLDILEELPTDAEAFERENAIIRETETLGTPIYNRTIEGKLNYELTDEIREKLRASGKKGSRVSSSRRVGIPLSPEHREKLREASKRYWQRKRETQG